MNLFIPEKPCKKDVPKKRPCDGLEDSTSKKCFLVIGKTTNLTWRSTIDEVYFTRHRQILGLLIRKF